MPLIKYKPIKVGDKFGKLTVVSAAAPHSRRNGYTRKRWVCVCECGSETIVLDESLKSGNTLSCGCFSSRALIGERSITHGARGSDEWKIWSKIKDRCFNPNCKEYPHYGARGVIMCAEWRDDFAAFLAHIGPRPSRDYSIERINNAGNYEPGNVRWATDLEQGRNRRNNRLLTVDGVTRCASEWAEVTGIKSATIINRMNKNWEPTAVVGVAPSLSNKGYKR